MKISQVISLLQDIQRLHGDLDVHVRREGVDKLPDNLQAKIRFKSELSPCTVEIIDDNNIKVIFDKPVKSPTPGQSLVLYSNEDMLLGGGIIKYTEE